MGGQWAAVHPRACGEQFIVLDGLGLDDGSSPRMRGTATRTTLQRPSRRFIPAHAGNRATMGSRSGPTTVHPRACGEQEMTKRKITVVSGSSPRMRGTAPAKHPTVAAKRFIPAHAGNRVPPSRSVAMTTVHPRACGEQATGRRLRLHSGRFIPAHAGNSTTRRSLTRPAPVHPRACGEQQDGHHNLLHLVGSSPRMRGTASVGFSRSAFMRFIPAHAGNSAQARARTRDGPVHPRACGEQADTPPPGPPPIRFIPAHAGNRPIRPPLAPPPIRFIPAHAGNSPLDTDWEPI